MGLLPGYETVGLLAPVALVPLRVVHIGRASRIEASSVDEYIEQLAHIQPEGEQDGQDKKERDRDEGR